MRPYDNIDTYPYIKESRLLRGACPGRGQRQKMSHAIRIVDFRTDGHIYSRRRRLVCPRRTYRRSCQSQRIVSRIISEADNFEYSQDEWQRLILTGDAHIIRLQDALVGTGNATNPIGFESAKFRIGEFVLRMFQRVAPNCVKRRRVHQ